MEVDDKTTVYEIISAMSDSQREDLEYILNSILNYCDAVRRLLNLSISLNDDQRVVCSFLIKKAIEEG